MLVKNFYSAFKKQYSSTSTSNTGENVYAFLFTSVWIFSHTIFKKKSEQILFKGKNNRVKLDRNAVEKAKYIWVINKSVRLVKLSTPNDLKNKVSKKLAK